MPVQAKNFWSVPRIFAALAVTLTLFLGIFSLGVSGLMIFDPPSAAMTEIIPPTQTSTPTSIPTLTPTHAPTITLTPSLTPDIKPPLLGDLQAEPEKSYYGQIAQRCDQDTTLALSVYADDPSGIREVWVIYWYEFSEERENLEETSEEDDDKDENPRYEAEMQVDDDNLYKLTIDHNEEERAEAVLGRQGGWLHWQVIAVDNFGNQTVRDGAPVALAFATCDVSPPRIIRAYTLPGSGTYGDFSFCGPDVSSYMELHVVLQDESAIRNVVAQYYYRGNTNGPLFTLNLVRYRGNGYHYYNFVDHNTSSHAPATLNNQDGQFFWRFIATDEYGNTVQSPLYIINIAYIVCPG